MNFDEAISEAYAGARIRPFDWPEGVYVEHSFARGLLKCWPVDCPSQEPSRTQCDYRDTADDRAGEWSMIERPAPVMGKPAASKWGTGKSATSNTPEYIAAVDDLIGATPPKVFVLNEGKWGATPKKEPNKWGQ